MKTTDLQALTLNIVRDNKIYIDKGFNSRIDYLDSLANENRLNKKVVYDYAEVMGEDADFNELLSAIFILKTDNSLDDIVDTILVCKDDSHIQQVMKILSDY